MNIFGTHHHAFSYIYFALDIAILIYFLLVITRRSQVSVHLVFPADRPPVLSAIDHAQGDCVASDLQWRQAETERRKRNMMYPINVARNVARTAANTSRVLVSDIELLPSVRLASSFMEMVHQRPPKVGVVFVLPVFEIESGEPPPATKRELLAASRAGLAVYFHRWTFFYNFDTECFEFKISFSSSFLLSLARIKQTKMCILKYQISKVSSVAGSSVHTASDFPD